MKKQDDKWFDSTSEFLTEYTALHNLTLPAEAKSISKLLRDYLQLTYERGYSDGRREG